MATSDPEALLKRLLKEPGENPWLEFKHNNSNPQVIGTWISACANAAILADVDRAFLVFGIENRTRRRVGTTVRLGTLKFGADNFTNWVSRLVEPRPQMEFLDFQSEGLNFSIITIEPGYDRPVKFSGTEYIRIGENIKKLSDFPDHERSLWLATSRRKFEDAVSLTHQSEAEVLSKLDVDIYFDLSKDTRPTNNREILRTFCSRGFVRDDLEGGYDITNLGAVLLAKDLKAFPSVASKAPRVIKYVGKNKQKSESEQQGTFGYAKSFSRLITFIASNTPSEETYVEGIRRMEPIYPTTAIREIVANALIHQDFTVSGAGPVIEIYSDRIEVTNPGQSLVVVDRIIDDRRSRNEKLASTMRYLGMCEERGGGLDKAMIETELRGLPAIDFISSQNSMRVVLFGPKPFSQLTKTEKLWACYLHCVLKYIQSELMGNSSLRERFKLPDDEYQAVSAIIKEAINKGRIIPADPQQGNRYAKYKPYWA